MSNFSVFVNTTDSFEDCWLPFFKLFSTYYPDHEGKIYLNTETKSYTYPGLNIISVRNNAATPDQRKTWSDCVKTALESIEHDIVLYLQDDYFFKDFVKHDIIEGYATLMRENDIDVIHLTDQYSTGPFHNSPFTGLKLVDKNAPGRIGCQAALWKKSVLTKYLRSHESGWQFEQFGTKRAHLLNDKFYAVDNAVVMLDKYEIVPYIFTGIVQGKWLRGVVDLFAKHDITMDFTRRGFKDASFKPAFYDRLVKNIKRKPNEIRSLFDLFLLRLSR